MVRKKNVIKGLMIICSFGVFFWSLFLFTNAKADNYSEVIRSYYYYISNGEHENAVSLYGGELKCVIEPFMEEQKENKGGHEGFYNVNNVTIDSIINIQNVEHDPQYSDYSGIRQYFVKCQMEVVESDKYYREGVNYFLFWIGVDESNHFRIINIEIPAYGIIDKYEQDKDNIREYSIFRNQILYPDHKNDYTYRSDMPAYIDYVANPTYIRLESVGTLNFVNYCTTVAAGEINTLSTTNGSRAAAMAIKMYSMHAVKTAASGSNYDISLSQQYYNPNITISSTAQSAISFAMSYFLLDYYGANFKTFYVDQYASGSPFCYAIQNGGVLSQNGCDSLASQYSWQNILKYYYTRGNVTYYNPYMNYGNLITCTSHSHDWSNAYYCPICGATVP